jgi:predicted TIM-barrel fold metal-dependent hydrolase
MVTKIISADSHITEPPDTYTARIDPAFRERAPHGALSKLPSEYFWENVYLTFQDDWIAFRMVDMVNFRRLLWANDFPHSDSTWPCSQDVLAAHTRKLGAAQRDAILHDNVAELYAL